MDALEELVAQLEPMVDRHTIADVLESLAVLAALKAEHVSTNWGDRTLARSWERVARKIEQAVTTAREHAL
jgi:hypothetical protein